MKPSSHQFAAGAAIVVGAIVFMIWHKANTPTDYAAQSSLPYPEQLQQGVNPAEGNTPPSYDLGDVIINPPAKDSCVKVCDSCSSATAQPFISAAKTYPIFSAPLETQADNIASVPVTQTQWSQ